MLGFSSSGDLFHRTHYLFAHQFPIYWVQSEQPGAARAGIGDIHDTSLLNKYSASLSLSQSIVHIDYRPTNQSCLSNVTFPSARWLVTTILKTHKIYLT